MLLASTGQPSFYPGDSPKENKIKEERTSINSNNSFNSKDYSEDKSKESKGSKEESEEEDEKIFNFH